MIDLTPQQQQEIKGQVMTTGKTALSWGIMYAMDIVKFILGFIGGMLKQIVGK